MKLALLDIDGLVANDSHRVQFALDRNWARYFDPRTVAEDDLWIEGRQLAEDLIEDGWHIAYLTGRRSVLRSTTEAWLDKHLLPIGRLIMRESAWNMDREKMPLANFKVQIIQALMERPDVDEICLWDDDPEVVRKIQDEVGSQHAVLCTWNIKPTALIKKATA